jgi:2-dehydropantoate 2-reductase
VFVGAGAVGGCFGAMLARRGYDVKFVARGAHLDAIQKTGLRVEGPVGDFTVQVPAASDPVQLGPADVVVLTVKTYDNATALPLLQPLLRAGSVVLTLQNGVDSAEHVAKVAGERATLAGAAYVAAALERPGLIRQTGVHRRIVFGEYFDRGPDVSMRVAALARVLADADLQADPVADARVAIWTKFAYLAPFAAFTGAARLPIGRLWADEQTRELFLQAVAEVEGVAAAHGVSLPAETHERIVEYLDSLDPSTRSSLLIDLEAGKRIEVEALQGAVVRRGRQTHVATPIHAALYAVLRQYANGRVA